MLEHPWVRAWCEKRCVENGSTYASRVVIELVNTTWKLAEPAEGTSSGPIDVVCCRGGTGFACINTFPLFFARERDKA